MHEKIKNFIIVTLTGYFGIFISLIRNFIYAYLLSTSDYAQVQEYLLYVSYAWVFLLGITDGIYINYGKCDLEDVPIFKFRTYTRILFGLQLFIFFIGFIAMFFVSNKLMLLCIMFGILINNMIAYYSVINQFTCRFREDSISTILLNVVQVVLIVGMIMFKLYSHQYVILCLILSSLISLCLLVVQNKEITFGKCDADYICCLKDILSFVKCGFFVMVSVTIGKIVVGIDKLFVNNLFETLDFAMYSFAVSVITLFYTIINSSSKIIFPYLARSDSDKRKEQYILMSNFITFVGVILLSTYFIIAPLIKFVLPKYGDSLVYLGILFPSVIFKLIFNLVMDNFYKVMNCIKEYTVNGILVMFFAIALDSLAYVFTKNICMIAWASIVTFVIWFSINELFFARKFKWKSNSIAKKNIYILIGVISFYFFSRTVTIVGGICFFVINLLVGMVFFNDSIRTILKMLIGNRRK